MTDTEGGDISLIIVPDGGAVHTRKQGNVQTQVDAPIHEFSNDHIIVSFLLLTIMLQND